VVVPNIRDKTTATTIILPIVILWLMGISTETSITIKARYLTTMNNNSISNMTRMLLIDIQMNRNFEATVMVDYLTPITDRTTVTSIRMGSTIQMEEVN